MLITLDNNIFSAVQRTNSVPALKTWFRQNRHTILFSNENLVEPLHIGKESARRRRIRIMTGFGEKWTRFLSPATFSMCIEFYHVLKRLRPAWLIDPKPPQELFRQGTLWVLARYNPHKIERVAMELWEDLKVGAKSVQANQKRLREIFRTAKKAGSVPLLRTPFGPHPVPDLSFDVAEGYWRMNACCEWYRGLLNPRTFNLDLLEGVGPKLAAELRDYWLSERGKADWLALWQEIDAREMPVTAATCLCMFYQLGARPRESDGLDAMQAAVLAEAEVVVTADAPYREALAQTAAHFGGRTSVVHVDRNLEIVPQLEKHINGHQNGHLN